MKSDRLASNNWNVFIYTGKDGAVHMRSFWMLVVRGSLTIFIAGVVGCLILDLMYLVFDPRLNRFKHLSVVLDSLWIFIGICVAGAFLGSILAFFVEPQIQSEDTRLADGQNRDR
jgi:hypothetical protein